MWLNILQPKMSNSISNLVRSLFRILQAFLIAKIISTFLLSRKSFVISSHNRCFLRHILSHYSVLLMFAFLPPFLFYFPLSFLSFLTKARIPSLFLLGSQYRYSGSCNYNYTDVKQLRWNDWFENSGLRQTLRKKGLRLLQIDLPLLLLQYWWQTGFWTRTAQYTVGYMYMYMQKIFLTFLGGMQIVKLQSTSKNRQVLRTCNDL